MALAALAVKLTSRGPVLFSQERVGLNGRAFRVYKFRSMRQGAEDARPMLERLNERQARVVEFRFFAGMGLEETAEALDVSPATVKRDWTVARAC